MVFPVIEPRPRPSLEGSENYLIEGCHHLAFTVPRLSSFGCLGREFLLSHCDAHPHLNPRVRPWGFLFLDMSCQCGCSNLELRGVSVPTAPRVLAVFDGQNVSRSARRCFGYRYPHYDPAKLAEAALKSSRRLSQLSGARLTRVHYYTGVPMRQRDPFWAHYDEIKNARFGQSGSPERNHGVIARPLRYADDIPAKKASTSGSPSTSYG